MKMEVTCRELKQPTPEGIEQAQRDAEKTAENQKLPLPDDFTIGFNFDTGEYVFAINSEAFSKYEKEANPDFVGRLSSYTAERGWHDVIYYPGYPSRWCS